MLRLDFLLRVFCLLRSRFRLCLSPGLRILCNKARLAVIALLLAAALAPPASAGQQAVSVMPLTDWEYYFIRCDTVQGPYRTSQEAIAAGVPYYYGSTAKVISVGAFGTAQAPSYGPCGSSSAYPPAGLSYGEVETANWQRVAIQVSYTGGTYTDSIHVKRQRTAGCPPGHKMVSSDYKDRCDPQSGSVNPAKNMGDCAGCSGPNPGGGDNVGGATGNGSNPVNAAQGNKVQRELDYRSSGSAGALEFTRYYNSQLDRGGRALPSGLGAKWTSTYSRSVLSAKSALLSAMVARPSGKVLFFTQQAGGGWAADSDVADKLEKLGSNPPPAASWRYTVAADDTVEYYDIDGRLLSIVARTGYTQTMAYSNASTPTAVAPVPGLLIGVVDSFGRRLSFTYDARVRIATLSDAGGGQYQYGYDATDSLVSVTYPDGTVRRYVYNEAAFTGGANLPRHLTGIVDENGDRFSTYRYTSSPLGWVTGSEHASGASRFQFSYSGTSGIVLDPLGTARTFSFQPVLGLLKTTSVSQPCDYCQGSAKVQGYDANGYPGFRTDWNGNRTNFSYDSRGLQTVRTEGLNAAGAPTAATRTITTQWHPSLRLPTRISEPGRRTDFGYDANGNVLTRTVTDTASARSRTWAYTYNQYGQVLTIDGPRGDLADVTTYTYDDAGNVSSITNALGQMTKITAYNAHGQPMTIVDPNDVTTTLTYDARQRLSTRSVAGETTTYAYDGVGQLTRVTLPDGSYLNYTYDAAQRLTGMADSLGNRIAYTLDAMGNRTREQTFDPDDQLAQTRSRAYGALNRLAQEIGAQNQTTTYAYDSQGNVSSVTDPLDRLTANGYDALNRLVRVTDPAAGQTQYAYNGLDQLTAVTDPRGLTTGYTYDALGNLPRQQSPDTGTTANTYDDAGNLLTQTDAKGQTTRYAYDALNRLTGIRFADGSAHAYAYDQGSNGIGRLTTISDPTGSTQYRYDALGRVTEETRTIAGIAYRTGYAYDPGGRLASTAYPSGRVVSYAYDGAGRIAAVSTTRASGGILALASNVGYQPFGGVKAFVFGNGQSYARTYDSDGRITRYTLGDRSQVLGFDAASRIISLGDPQKVLAYAYDALDRLSSATGPGIGFGYAYDAVGNRTSQTGPQGTSTLSYAADSNRLLSVAGPAPSSFSYDANGSVIANGATGTSGATQFAYDSRGRMVRAQTAGGTFDYAINALGQRIRKTGPGVDTVFHYDLRGRLIGESDVGGRVQREYVYLHELPLAVFAQRAPAVPEVVIDNTQANFTGTWPRASSPPGFQGADYQTHAGRP